MREIKFRAWNKKYKTWLFDYKEMGGFSLIGEVTLVAGLRETSLKEWQNIEIMQFTGLKDSKNCEIYEGDIVNLGQKDHAVPEVVIFKDGAFGAEVDWLPEDPYIELNEYCCDSSFINCVEVLGNIYENKELLDKT